MKLFDDYQRDDLSSSDDAEHRFSFLNRSARPVFQATRQTLEDWFSRYPIEAQEELRTRFRDLKAESNHQSAFFELFLHELFYRGECKVEVHPCVAETARRPDFLVELPCGNRFYLEARVATGLSHKAKGTEAILNRFYDSINDIESPDFFLLIEAHNLIPATPLKVSRIRKTLQQWIKGLNYDEIARQAESESPTSLPKKPFWHEDKKITFTAFPKGSTRGRADVKTLGNRPTRFEWGDMSIDLIKDAVKKKNGRYGTLDLPYVIGIHVVHQLCRPASAELALYGPQGSSTTLSLPERAIARSDYGVWTSARGPKLTRLGGVLILRDLFPWALRPTQACLYHNPWAIKPVVGNLPQFEQAVLTEGGVRYVTGDAMLSLLDLPESWPEIQDLS